MSGSAFHALQDIHERKRPTLRVALRREQQVNVIWHYHDSVESNSFSVLAQALSQNQIASRSRQWRQRPCAEGDEQITVSFLQMRKPSAIPIFRQRHAGHECGVEREFSPGTVESISDLEEDCL